jgi:DNA-binding CsgD family transcriptional regulator
VLSSLATAPKLKTVDARGLSLLSKREAEVVRCVTEGLTNREIAERLDLSQHTIKNHLFRIFDKLGVSNRIELLFVTLSQRTSNVAAGLRFPDLLTDPCGECDDASLAVCEKAAEHGVLAAQLMLARTAGAGGATDHNRVRACMWLSVALEQLTRFKNNAQKSMTPAQLAEVERQLRDRWSKKPQVERNPNAETPSDYRRVVA